MQAPALLPLAGAALRVGCLGIGGPAAQIALMHRIFVEEKKWIRQEDYMHALGYCMLLPGPEAQQLATFCGWQLRGIPGGLVTGLLFVLPGASFLMILCWAYAMFGTLPGMNGLFYGIKAAMIAVILAALLRIGRQTLSGAGQQALALCAFLALWLFEAPFLFVIAATGLAGVALRFRTPAPDSPAGFLPHTGRQLGQLLRTALVWAIVWLTPVLAAVTLLGPDHLLSRIGLLFSKLAMIAFGGAYSLLAYLNQQAVDHEGWLTQAQIIDGTALSGMTPGPMALINQFTGFMAGWQADGGGPALAIAGALMASWCTFAPGFVWIFAGAPFSQVLRANAPLRAAMTGITAGVCGIIAVVAVGFCEAVLLGPGSGRIIPSPGPVDIPAALITTLAVIGLVRFRISLLAVLAAGAGTGLCLQFGANVLS